MSLCRKTVKKEVVHSVPGSLVAAGRLSCVLFFRCGAGFEFTFTHNDALWAFFILLGSGDRVFCVFAVV